MQSEDTQSEAKINLARRAVASKRWRWMPGMRDTDGAIVVFVDGSWLVTTVYIDDRDGWSTGSRLARNALPDLDDPATLGCLLALVREAWSEPGAYARESSRGGWGVYMRSAPGGGRLAEALVAALEAAP